MKATSDVIVIGGGPCGSFAALNLAKRGANVMVFEEHSEIGFPSHCAGHLSIRGLKNLGLHKLPAKIIENTFQGAIFHSPQGKSLAVRFSKPVTCVINRALFDKYIAEMAEDAGVCYSLNSHVVSPKIENGVVKGVIVKRYNKMEEKFARIIVDAEGISSIILKQAGLVSLNCNMLVNGVEAEVENIKNTESDMVEVFLGRDYAPGFYAWVIPKRDKRAKVGLATKKRNPKELLQRLMLKHPVASEKLRSAKILQMGFHPLTLGGPIPRVYSSGFLVVGDAASQVKPTTGGGVILGMTCAKVAADVAYKALNRNDFSSNFLSAYQKRCNKILGFDVKLMLGFRKMLDKMSDKKLDDLISLCTKFDLNKVLRNVKDLDFQGKAFLCSLRNPRMLTSLFYFFFLYLSAKDFKNLRKID